MSVGSWLRGRRSSLRVRRAERSEPACRRLVAKPNALTAEDALQLARLLVLKRLEHRFEEYCRALGERSGEIEPCLWELARAHRGGRYWRDLLWKHARRDGWQGAHWREFADLCGATGELTGDVARLAGIEDGEWRRWWRPFTPRLIMDQPSTAGAKRTGQPGWVHVNGTDEPGAFETYLSELKATTAVGLELLSAGHLEDLAVGMIKHDARMLAQHLLTFEGHGADYAAIEQSGCVVPAWIVEARRLKGMTLDTWMSARAIRWTTSNEPGQQLSMLRELREVVSEEQLRRLELNREVLRRLHVGGACPGGWRLSSLLRAIAALHRHDLQLERMQFVNQLTTEFDAFSH
jgi:hypothetical protein